MPAQLQLQIQRQGSLAGHSMFSRCYFRRRLRPRISLLSSLRLERLEERTLLTAAIREEYLLELLNRMRTDPADELPLLLNSNDPNVTNALSYYQVNTTVLAQQWATLTPVPPLDYNDDLQTSALNHSMLMSQDDEQRVVS